MNLSPLNNYRTHHEKRCDRERFPKNGLKLCATSRQLKVGYRNIRILKNDFSLISFTTLLKTMTTLRKRFALLLALPISILANFSLKASADSTAGIILSTKCRGGYNINILQNYTSGELLYRSTSPNGNLSLGRGTSQATEGVRVYKFRNGNYEYWVWDGTLDNPQLGTLEVYKNNRILMRQACTKS